MHADVAVVIVNFNSGSYLTGCVESLAEPSQGIAREIVVVDDASTVDQAEHLAEAEARGARVLRLPQNTGYAGGCNRGVAATRGRFVLLLNADVVACAGALPALVRFLAERPDFALIEPRCYVDAGRDWQQPEFFLSHDRDVGGEVQRRAVARVDRLGEVRREPLRGNVSGARKRAPSPSIGRAVQGDRRKSREPATALHSRTARGDSFVTSSSSSASGELRRLQASSGSAPRPWTISWNAHSTRRDWRASASSHLEGCLPERQTDPQLLAAAIRGLRPCSRLEWRHGAQRRARGDPVTDPRFAIRPFQAGDEERVLAFHNRAFAPTTRSRRHFDWRFRDNPAGPPELVLALEGDVCVAVYAVLPVRCLVRGEPALGGLQTDMAVAPELRRGLGGSRLIMAVGEAYQRHFLNGTKALEWGFPEPELQRVCLAHLKVGVLRDVCFLVRRVAREWTPAGGLEVSRVARLSSETDELWRGCATRNGGRGAFDTATIRDARYLNWRYAAHPDVEYLLFEARSSGVLRGLAVFREGGPDPQLFSLMDWLVPHDDRESERALLGAGLDEARRRSRPFLAAWIPLGHPLALRWQEEYGFFAKSTPFQECYRAWRPGLGRRWLGENWFQSMGDIDFF